MGRGETGRPQALGRDGRWPDPARSAQHAHRLTCLLAQSFVGRGHPRFRARGRHPEVPLGKSRQAAAVVFGEDGAAEGDERLQHGHGLGVLR
ncbi:hypothetical protein [Streptomyces sp. Ncost-T10-10d]|uniref:hypothetical protein n=1 Tax=Streptomyces sp. Ncost-T10-10d TaxID=1839774 RepID=UPI000B83D235|nr:hypothetical protein [Streptomyces sp. Ncost-T10-10d]